MDTRGETGEGPRILLAEDNPTNQKVAQLLLRKLGYSADDVADGREAVDAMRATDYDVILMDVQMPVMDGLEATRVIRAELPPERQPYIVGLTAGAFTEDRNACYSAGMDAYVTKPVRQDELADAIAARRDRAPAAPSDQPADESGAAPEPAAIDPTALDQLSEGLGPELAAEAVHEVIDSYLAQTPASIEDLVTAVNRQDLASVHRAAHLMRSSSAAVGATRLTTVLETIESRARETDPDTTQLNELAQRLRIEFEPAERELRQRDRQATGAT